MQDYQTLKKKYRLSYKNGARAYISGQAVTKNPYSRTDSREQWERGWRDAERLDAEIKKVDLAIAEALVAMKPAVEMIIQAQKEFYKVLSPWAEEATIKISKALEAFKQASNIEEGRNGRSN